MLFSRPPAAASRAPGSSSASRSAPPPPPRTRRRSYISDLGGGDSAATASLPAPAFAPPSPVASPSSSSPRGTAPSETERATSSCARSATPLLSPAMSMSSSRGRRRAATFLAGDADGERALESAFLIGLAGISSMITPPVLLVPRGDDPPVRSRTASPWFLDRNATVTTSTSTVRPAYPVRVHANPHPASCARLSLNTSENRCHASLHAASHASITRGPIARTTGAHANAPTQTNATVASGPSHHTLATEETIHAHTRTRAQRPSRARALPRHQTLDRDPKLRRERRPRRGARGHPPAELRRDATGGLFALPPAQGFEAKSGAAPSAAEAPEPSSAPSRNGSGCESAA